MKVVNIILTSLFCSFILLNFYGCGEEGPAATRDFTIKNFRNKLYSTDFVDKMNGWISGDYGLIWQTKDGGKTWLPQKSGTILPLRGISFGDKNNGWTVGDQGIILHTSDGGNTWVKQESGIEEDLLNIKFLNSQTGFAIGEFAAILFTEDGGRNWQDISQKIREEEIELQFFLAEGEPVEAVEETGLDEEIDIMEEGMPVMDPLLNGIFFVDSQNGWLVGEEGNIFYTQDGGKRWGKQESKSKEDLFGVFFKDLQEGWITGLNGLLLHTVDGGATWKKQEFPMEETQFGIVMTGSRGYTVGYAASMMTTTDGGKTWEAFTPEGITLFSWFRDIISVDGEFVAIGGLGTILITENGGKNWKQIT